MLVDIDFDDGYLYPKKIGPEQFMPNPFMQRHISSKALNDRLQTMLRFILTLLAVLYAISPFDLLPEFATGVLGFIDDFIILFVLWRVFYSQRAGSPFGTTGSKQGRFFRNESYGANGNIPDTEREKDPYEVLNISHNASPDEIKAAYKKLAGQYHPDKVHHLADEFKDLAEEKFKEIQGAYDKIRRD